MFARAPTRIILLRASSKRAPNDAASRRASNSPPRVFAALGDDAARPRTPKARLLARLTRHRNGHCHERTGASGRAEVRRLCRTDCARKNRGRDLLVPATTSAVSTAPPPVTPTRSVTVVGVATGLVTAQAWSAGAIVATDSSVFILRIMRGDAAVSPEDRYRVNRASLHVRTRLPDGVGRERVRDDRALQLRRVRA